MKLFINILIVLLVVAIDGYALYHFNKRIDNIEIQQSALDVRIVSAKQHLDEITAKLAHESPSGAYIEEPTKQTDFSKDIDE